MNIFDDESHAFINRLEKHLKQYTNNCFMNELEDGCIFHYSTIPSFFNGILSFESNNQKPLVSLMATDCEYLNDPEEIKYGIKTVKTIYKQLGYPPSKKALSPVKNFFLTSFSKDKDSIPMWNQYAQGGFWYCPWL